MIIKATKRAALTAYYAACVLVIVACVVLLSLRYFLSPVLSDRKEQIASQIEQQLTDYPGAEVRIGSITFGSNIYRNFLNIDKISAVDGDTGRELFHIENAYIEVSLLNLYRQLQGEQVKSPLRLALISPRLQVVRHSNGGLSIGGWPVVANENMSSDWRVPLGRVVVADAIISFLDETREFENRKFTNIDFAAEHLPGKVLFALEGISQGFGNTRLTAEIEERAFTMAHPAGAEFHFELALPSFEVGKLRLDRGILRILGTGTLEDSGADIDYRMLLNRGDLAFDGGSAIATKGSLNGRLKVGRSPLGDWTAHSASALALSGIEVDIPEATLHPQKIDSLTAELGFAASLDRWQVAVQDATAENKEVQLAFTFGATGGSGPLYIDFAGSSRRPLAAPLAPKYLPAQAGETLAAWLGIALRKGSVQEIDVRVRGRPEEFPYADGEDGEFALAIRFDDVDFEYWPGWPAISAADGSIVFSNKQMLVDLDSGSIEGLDVSGSEARIPDLLTFDEQLLITLAGNADGGTLLTAAGALPPLGKFNLTRQIELLAEADMSVAVGIPIRRPEDISIEGRLGLSGDSMRLPELNFIDGNAFAMENLDLDIGFSGESAQIGGSGDLLGQGAQVKAEIGFDSWEVELRTAARVEDWLAYAGISADSGVIRGETSVVIRASSAGTQELASDLLGVEVALPLPLGKTRVEARPVRLIRNADGAAVDYGDGLLQLHLLDDGARTRVLAGINQQPPPADILGDYVVRGAIADIDLDSWIGYAMEGGGSEKHIDARIKAGKAVFGGRANEWFDVEMSANGQGTTVAIDSEHVAGTLTISRNETGELVAVANLDRLRIGDDSEEKDEDDEDYEEKAAPKNFPELPRVVFAAQEVQLGKRSLGRVSIEGAPVGNEWILEQLVSEKGTNTLSVTGTSTMQGDPHSTADFSMEIGDIRQFMRDWGVKEETVSEGQTTISGQIKWGNSLLNPDLGIMGGEMALSASNARFASADTGIFKLMRLLTPDAFLNLGFTETLREGVEFEKVTADFRLEQGYMSTENLTAASDDISVELSGGTDLDKETLNFRGKIRPGVAALNALLGATMIATAPAAPVSAVVGWLAGKILKEPIDAIKEPFSDIGSYEYTITGNWDEPVYEEI